MCIPESRRAARDTAPTTPVADTVVPFRSMVDVEVRLPCTYTRLNSAGIIFARHDVYGELQVFIDKEGTYGFWVVISPGQEPMFWPLINAPPTDLTTLARYDGEAISAFKPTAGWTPPADGSTHPQNLSAKPAVTSDVRPGQFGQGIPARVDLKDDVGNELREGLFFPLYTSPSPRHRPQYRMPSPA